MDSFFRFKGEPITLVKTHRCSFLRATGPVRPQVGFQQQRRLLFITATGS